MKRLLALALLAGCAPTPPTEKAPHFWAGVAAVEITPTRNVPLAGYPERGDTPMTGVHDPLYAKALWIEDDTARVCIVSADILCPTLELRNRIKPENADVILLGSGTHSGPAFDAELFEETVAKLTQAVEAARAAAQPARLAFARGTTIDILLVSRDHGRPLAVLAGVDAPANILKAQNMLLSGDWPGAFQRRLEARLRIPVLFANGASDDTSPATPEGRNAFERCEAMGEDMARETADMARGFDNAGTEATINYVETGETGVVGLLTIDGVRIFCLPGRPDTGLEHALTERFPGSWVLGAANDNAEALLEQCLRLDEGINAENRAPESEGGSGEDDDGR